jgi:hypothetical protein
LAYDRLVNDELGSARETVGDLAVAVARVVVVAPLFVLMMTALPIVATTWAFDTGSLALETLVAVLSMSATFAWLLWEFAFGWTRWQLRFGRFAPTVRATALAFFAVVSFTSLTALLHDQGLLDVTPEPARDHLLGDTASFYVWQLANTVPLVDITGNLDWHKPFEFDDRLGGFLVILFTGFVIFPLIQLARLILAGGDVSFDLSVQRALDKHVDRPFFDRHREGNSLTIAEQGVRIDVMSTVWNHDAVLKRLERLGNRPAGRWPIRGYLLVVDAIAEAARERIERALSQAPFEASLAVWRPDQPAKELIAALERLQQRMKAPQERVEAALPSD